MGYKGISEAEAIRRRGKFGKPQRGGHRGMGERECNEDEIKRRNEIASDSDSSENSSEESSENSSECSSDVSSEKSSGDSEESSATSGEESSEYSSDDDSTCKLGANLNQKSASNDKESFEDGAAPGSKSQLRKDMAKLAIIKKQREEAARRRLASQQ